MAIPNRPERRSRPQVYDTEQAARKMRAVFTAAPVAEEKVLPFTWPSALQWVGDSVGVGYASDKWKNKGDFQLYKHVAESRNRLLVIPSFIHDYACTTRQWEVVGPRVQMADIPMPKHVATLAHFDTLFAQTFARISRGGVPLVEGDDGYIQLTVSKGILGGSVLPWSRIGVDREDQPFLFVYTEPCPRDRDPGGVKIIIVGEELAVEADGIVG